MKTPYSFIAFAALGIDRTYDRSNKLLKETGGVAALNALYNLGLLGERAYAVGIVGNDANGHNAMRYLADGGVDVSHVEARPKETHVTHILLGKGQGDESSLVTPAFQLSYGKPGEPPAAMPTDLPERFRGQDIILIVSNFESSTHAFIRAAKKNAGKLVVSLDVNRRYMFLQRPVSYLEEFLRDVDMVQLNQQNAALLMEKLGIESYIELLDRFGLLLLTVTKGAEGAEFVYKTGDCISILEKKTITRRDIIDPTGAGDAFHAMILKAYHRILLRGEPITEVFLDKAFYAANKLAGRMVTVIGARGPADIVADLFDNEEKKARHTTRETVPSKKER